MKNVDIFGTCFSRELFNYPENYLVNTYLMQQSIYTLNSNSYPIALDKIRTKDNYAFKNRMIYYDFNKIAFSKLRKNPSEYLIVDFADQSRDIVVLDNYNNVRLTATSAMLEVLLQLGENYHIENIDDYSTEKLYHCVQQLSQIFLSLYDKEKIILNKIQMQNKYYVCNEEKYIDDSLFVYRRKSHLALLESIFLEIIPDCKILETKQEPILDINHRFGGPYPMHFEEIYYKYRMNLLDALIGNKPIDKIENDYREKLNSSLKQIKSKKLVHK